jgi:hypothetical protein
MSSYGWFVRSIAALVILALAGCATAAHAVDEQSVAPERVRTAQQFYLLPLRVDMPPVEEPGQWQAHVNAWTQAFWDGVDDYARRWGGHVRMVQPGEPIGDGVVVAARVTALHDAGVLGFAHVDASVQLSDARTSQPLVIAKLDANSNRPGPEGYTFGGRIKFCTLNLAKAVALAMHDGRFPR